MTRGCGPRSSTWTSTRRTCVTTGSGTAVDPLGSGAVESAIRRVINLRLKGNGIYWREENAEAMLVLRAAALTGRWQETMERTQVAMARDRRRDWQWEAPDIVAELNSGCADQATGVAT